MAVATEAVTVVLWLMNNQSNTFFQYIWRIQIVIDSNINKLAHSVRRNSVCCEISIPNCFGMHQNVLCVCVNTQCTYFQCGECDDVDNKM